MVPAPRSVGSIHTMSTDPDRPTFLMEPDRIFLLDGPEMTAPGCVCFGVGRPLLATLS